MRQHSQPFGLTAIALVLMLCWAQAAFAETIDEVLELGRNPTTHHPEGQRASTQPISRPA